MSSDRPLLEVHVLGAGKGESIVIRLPDGLWGVVDCYSKTPGDPDSNATIRFLRERGVVSLEFLCLTHPHDDHFRGMSCLLELYRPRLFWRFGALSPTHVERLLRYLKLKSIAKREAEFSTSADELFRVFKAVREGVKARRLTVSRASMGTPLYPDPVSNRPDVVRIVSLAPPGNQAERYESLILDVFDEHGNLVGNLPDASHNTVSMALLLVFGKTRLILGGDVVTSAWREILSRYDRDELRAHAVKVSHHGSPTGYVPGLWECFGREVKPMAVVTSYVSQGLPRRVALDHIDKHANPIISTCLTSTRELQWPLAADPPSLRCQIALMSKMKLLDDGQTQQCGRCSLTFDDEGQCVRTEIIPPAGYLVDPRLPGSAA